MTENCFKLNIYIFLKKTQLFEIAVSLSSFWFLFISMYKFWHIFQYSLQI